MPKAGLADYLFKMLSGEKKTKNGCGGYSTRARTGVIPPGF